MKLFLKLRKIKLTDLERVRERIGDCILVAKSTLAKRRLYNTGIKIEQRISQRYYLFGEHESFMNKLYEKMKVWKKIY